MPNTFIDNTQIRVDTITDSAGTGAPVFPAGITASAPSLLVAGSAAAPGLSFVGDTNLGLFRKAADSLGFAAQGVEIGSFALDGAWTFGAAAGGALTHVFQSGGATTTAQITGTATDMDAVFHARSRGTFGAYFRGTIGTDTGTSPALTFDASINNTAIVTTRPAFGWQNYNLNFGRISAAGLWNIGEPGGNQTHVMNGNLTIAAQSGYTLHISKPSTNAPVVRWVGTASNDFHLGMQNAGGTFNVYANNGTTSLAETTQAGAWTLGPAASNVVHTIQGEMLLSDLTATGNKNVLILKDNTARANGTVYGLLFRDSAGEANARIYATHNSAGNNSAGLSIQVASGIGGGNPDVTAIDIFNNGTVHIGATTTAGQHLIRGGGNTTDPVSGTPLIMQNPVAAINWRVGPDNGVGASRFYIVNPGGTGAYIATGATSWTANSDSRMKKNIQNLNHGLTAILAISPKRFDYLTDTTDSSSRIGFIAQDLLPHLPEVVDSSNSAQYGVATTELIPVLVKAIQEQQALITALTTRISALEP